MRNIAKEELEQAQRQCESEPIHQIGQIQPYGALLVLSPDSRRIVLQASSNLEKFFDLHVAVAFGNPLAEVIGASQAEQIEQLIREARENNLAAKVVCLAYQSAKHNLQARVFLSGSMFVLELMRDPGVDQGQHCSSLLRQFQGALRTVNIEKDAYRYFDCVAMAVRELTEFDRVMVYRFDTHWEGEVIAESKSEPAHSYLGTRFPASDIPPQARQLYTRNPVRQIADVSAKNIPVVPAINPVTQQPLDLTHSALRSLSPVHVEYLRNMGVSASMSISLLQNGRLWGLIACHHMTPKQVPYAVQEAAAFVSEIISPRLSLIENQEQRHLGIEATRIVGELLTNIATATEGELQLKLLPDLQALFAATGIVMAVEGKHHVHGDVPEPGALDGVTAWLGSQPATDVFACDNLAMEYAPANAFAGVASGLLAAPLSSDMRNFIVWLRGERARTVRWAGNPEKVLSRDPAGVRLSPRKSFETWTELWRGRSEPWSHSETEAAQSIAQILTQGFSQKAKLEFEQAKSRKAERELLQSNLLLSSVVENIPHMVFLKRASDLRFELLNRAGEALLGRDRKDLLGRNDYDLLPAEQADTITRKDRATLARDGLEDIPEEPIDTPWGIRTLHTKKLTIRDELGRPQYLLGISEDITKLKLQELELRKFKAIIDSTDDAIISKTIYGVIQSWNKGAERIFGYTADEVIGKPFLLLIPEDRKLEESEILAKTTKGERIVSFDSVRVCKDGRWIDVSVTISPVLDEDGKVVGISKIARDISTRKNLEAALRSSESRLSSIFDSTPDAILISGTDGVITMANQQVEAMLGYQIGALIGQSIETLVPSYARENHQRLRDRFAGSSIARRMGTGLAVKAVRKDGSLLDVEVSLSRIQTDVGLFFASSLRDISERMMAQDKINDLAFFDQLTGLPNRTLLYDRMRQAKIASVRSGSYGALLFIDLDRFKTLNDTLGHDMGDLLLQQVAQRLTNCVRSGDTIARMGGDEFVVMLPSLSMSEIDAAAHTEAVGEKILATLNQPYQLKDVAYHSTPSIGATLFRGQQTSIDDLMKQADMAMYKSKAAGRNALHFFDPAMETEVLHRASLESDLREAIIQQQFLLHYQAQIAGGRVTGAEVLIRWQHPVRGMVSPADFIPLAEETGLIVPLGYWVLETACTQLAAWASQPEMAHLTLAVNVSAHQFRLPDFVDQIMAALNNAGANPQGLKLELTESLLVDNVEAIIEKMFALKAKGVGFSLDDFGTGYSSLSYLKRLPLDQLKIDQSFVRDVLTDPNDASIARTVIALAQNLGLGVIAEGVETEAQRDFLASSGCHAYQGYFFSRPLPLKEFEEFAKRI